MEETLRRIKLPKPTDLPISVFDYDNIKNYRFLATVGKSLYMYDKTGKNSKGIQIPKRSKQDKV